MVCNVIQVGMVNFLMELTLYIQMYMFVLNGLILIGMINYYKRIRRAIQLKLQLIKHRNY